MLRDLFSLFPAYAGVIPVTRLTARASSSFPRIRGGDPKLPVNGADINRLFPAYAGVIPSGGRSGHFLRSFPRIRGGDPLILLVATPG